MRYWGVLLFSLFSSFLFASEIEVGEMEGEVVAFLQENYKPPVTNSRLFRAVELEKSREEVHGILLQEYKKILPSSKNISWGNVQVIGWPSDVLFYCKHCWTVEDCLSLKEALREEKISFFLSKSCAKPPSLKQREGLKMQLQELSGKIFGGVRVQWQKIKVHFPRLHLRHGNILNFGWEDFTKTEEVVKELQAMAADMTEAEGSKSDLCVLKDEIYAKLLVLYQELYPSHSYIFWSSVDVIGWPESVIFYQKAFWSTTDCIKLLEAMEGIRFVRNDNIYSAISPDEKSELTILLEEFFWTNFGINYFEWRLIKDICPHFHLNRNFNWTGKDAQMIQSMMKCFEKKKRNFSSMEGKEDHDRELKKVHK